MACCRWMSAWLLLCVAVAAQTPLRPVAIAYDAAGDLYIADAARHQVLESTVGGVLRLVAGTGRQGFAGDGGAATSAMFNRPAGVAVAADGTVYIADTGNQRIRAIATDGTISTVAGSGAKGFAGDGGAALTAAFCEPSGLASSGTALYVADRCNQRVRVLRSGVVSTVAGTGVQGFAGDGGLATAAELDEPLAVAVDAAGRLFVADTRNDRIRVVGVDGKIATFAGSGIRGFGGDGGPATAAKLSMPAGVAAMPDGSVTVADAGNQRLRSVDAAGVIATIAGSGAQGALINGASAAVSPLNELRGLAASAYGVPVLSDARAMAVVARMDDGRLYDAAGLATRASTMQLTLPSSATYGAVHGAVVVSGQAATPQGVVNITEADAPVATASLSSGGASFTVDTLPAGTHALVAKYAGDGFNPAAVSATSSVSIERASVVATATDISTVYGQPLPAFTGTVSGILPQDQALESVTFASVASSLAKPGSYPITAALTGPASGNYVVTDANDAGTVQVGMATSHTSASSGTAYAGMPLTLTATVAPQFSGVPTGSVQFAEGGNVIATGTLAGGVATAVYLSPPTGSHTITAQYAGDENFHASTSAPMTTVVGALPDFTMSAQGSSTQLVNAGSNAIYTVTLLSTSAGFSSAVSIAVSGLPTNVQVSVTPQLLVPVMGGSVVSVVVPTATLTSANRSASDVNWACLSVGSLLLAFCRKRRRWTSCTLGVLLLASGCGARTAPESRVAARSYTLHVTGTATSLTGTLLTHTVDLSLQVQ